MKRWQLVSFCPKTGLALSFHEAKRLLALVREGGEGLVSVDLGSRMIDVTAEGGLLQLDGVVVSIEKLEYVVEEGEEDAVFFFEREGGVLKVAFYRGGRYYKLKSVGEGLPPTLDISGIHMHNIVGTDPWSDAKRKVDLVKPGRGDVVLDICTGLGYTAIHSAARGAEVLSIEKDPAVLEIAEYNPWSRALSSPRITLLLGDAFEVIEELPENYFSAAIHDPPRFALAGELYSLDFYRKLRRVLKRGALLFHYTGWPGKHRGINIQAGVANRLRISGFEVLRAIKGYGVLARAI